MKLRIATRSISCKFKNEMRRRAQWRVDRGARISRVITGETPVPLARTCDGEGPTSIIPKSFVAHWCSWLTRCPLKAEITGSSPVCATKSHKRGHHHSGLPNSKQPDRLPALAVSIAKLARRELVFRKRWRACASLQLQTENLFLFERPFGLEVRDASAIHVHVHICLRSGHAIKAVFRMCSNAIDFTGELPKQVRVPGGCRKIGDPRLEPRIPKRCF